LTDKVTELSEYVCSVINQLNEKKFKGELSVLNAKCINYWSTVKPDKTIDFKVDNILDFDNMFIKQNLQLAFMNSDLELQIDDMMLIKNDTLIDQFKKKIATNPSSVKLCFHGTAETNVTAIVKSGFILKQILDAGWYGTGYYSTTYPEYAAQYAPFHNLVEVGKPFSLIVCYVYTGVVKEIDTQLSGDIAPNFDSHHVKVSPPLFKPTTPKDTVIYDEYVVRESSQILPFYIIRLKRISTVFIWKDQAINNFENSQLLNHLKGTYAVYGTSDTPSTIKIINRKKSSNKVYLICNGRDSEPLVCEARKLISTKILIFCENVVKHRQWASKYEDVQVTSATEDVLNFVVENNQKL